MAKAQLLNLGQAIKERREELKFSHASLARLFPVDPKTISRWEKAETSGAYDSLEEIAKHLETTPEALQARAIEIGRENGSGSSRKTPAEVPTDYAALEHAAVERHAELLAQIAELRLLVEDLRMQSPQDGPRAANG